jgi:hypothetical protein
MKTKFEKFQETTNYQLILFGSALFGIAVAVVTVGLSILYLIGC